MPFVFSQEALHRAEKEIEAMQAIDKIFDQLQLTVSQRLAILEILKFDYLTQTLNQAKSNELEVNKEFQAFLESLKAGANSK
ncbi:MAG: hypothetical protein Q7K42_03385 [Candidatus Diapherotrites archaeon]|nr:hypothetical protein [Candidatus Diapherotrites archaeon]